MKDLLLSSFSDKDFLRKWKPVFERECFISQVTFIKKVEVPSDPLEF